MLSNLPLQADATSRTAKAKNLDLKSPGSTFFSDRHDQEIEWAALQDGKNL